MKAGGEEGGRVGSAAASFSTYASARCLPPARRWAAFSSVRGMICAATGSIEDCLPDRAQWVGKVGFQVKWRRRFELDC
jgi:hypothetical protein